MLRDVSRVDTRLQLFGEWVESPVCVAPTAMQRMAHPEGEVATARGKIEKFAWFVASLVPNGLGMRLGL